MKHLLSQWMRRRRTNAARRAANNIIRDPQREEFCLTAHELEDLRWAQRMNKIAAALRPPDHKTRR